jgi:hypothetical protein
LQILEDSEKYWLYQLYQYWRYWKILENTGNTNIADSGRLGTKLRNVLIYTQHIEWYWNKCKGRSPHELVQITGQLTDCRSVHGFKSSFAFVPVPLDVLGVYKYIPQRNTRRYWSLPKYEYCRYQKILRNTGYTSIADTGRFWKILVIPVIADTGKYW